MNQEIIELCQKSEAEYESMINGIEEGTINVTYDYAFEKYFRFKQKGIIGHESYEDRSFDLFLILSKQLEGRDFWRLLNDCYMTLKHPLLWKHEIREAFQSDEPDQEYYMNQESREFYNNLPDGVTIYRGMSVTESIGKNYGISWTLSKDVADHFTKIDSSGLPTSEKKVMVSLMVPKDDIIAYSNEREEQEVIYLHSG